MLSYHPEPWTAEIEKEYHATFSTRIEQSLDAGYGACPLRDAKCARIVGDALAFFEGSRSTQLAWIVMPNHVHTLFVSHEDAALKQLVTSWKRHTAHAINQILDRKGALWQRDYFDRVIRDGNHFCNCVRYIRRNPEKARLQTGEYLLWESDLAREVE